MRRAAIGLIAVVCALALGRAGIPAENPEERPLIQIAILLDTSNSMDGLINQARAQLWKIVNEFIATKKAGQTPLLQVALYEYGNDGLSAEVGHIRQVLPLTDDLDKVSQELFALKTNGGQEYCGMVIQRAVENLQWSKSNDDLKAIFIAGNEPFTQGTVDYHASCKAAAARGIAVNTIFCGDHNEGVRTNWQDGALLADGRYISINQNQEVVHIAAPQDAPIAQLGDRLNATYVPYGAAGKAGKENQTLQDRNAGSLAPGSAVQRQITKSSKYYRNDTWDLVDAVRGGKVKVEEVKEADLPEAMRKMTPAERQAYIEKMGREREQIQKEIAQLNAERSKYVAEESKKQAGSNTLDKAVVEAVRAQAEKKNFK